MALLAIQIFELRTSASEAHLGSIATESFEEACTALSYCMYSCNINGCTTTL